MIDDNLIPNEDTRYVRYRGRIYLYSGRWGDMGGIKMNGKIQYRPFRLMKAVM